MRVKREAVAAAATVALLVALAAVGGVGYAASSVAGAVGAAKRVVSPHQEAASISLKAVGTAKPADDQYQPGNGYGDSNHDHDGPPGSKKGGGTSVARLASVKTVMTTFTVDEQASLQISLIGKRGVAIPLVRAGRIGGATAVAYRVLVPRAIQLRLRVPASLLRTGQVYRIRVVAVDRDGNASKLFIPFRG
jgi:hypothetical protein